jgi:hypothetical protein
VDLCLAEARTMRDGVGGRRRSTPCRRPHRRARDGPRRRRGCRRGGVGSGTGVNGIAYRSSSATRADRRHARTCRIQPGRGYTKIRNLASRLRTRRPPVSRVGTERVAGACSCWAQSHPRRVSQLVGIACEPSVRRCGRGTGRSDQDGTEQWGRGCSGTASGFRSQGARQPLWLSLMVSPAVPRLGIRRGALWVVLR